MPLYEYLCEDCDGVFEVVRPIREAPEPQPCPECDEECERVMPSSFSAYIMRQGYPRRIPDRGNYWHLGKEVTYLPKKARPYEHPQVTKQREKEPLATQDYVDLVDQKIAERRLMREDRRKERELKQERMSKKAKELKPAMPPKPRS